MLIHSLALSLVAVAAASPEATTAEAPKVQAVHCTYAAAAAAAASSESSAEELIGTDRFGLLNSFSCQLTSSQTSWSARASFSNQMNTTGWSELQLESNPDAKFGDEEQAFAAGYVEAALTADLIDMAWQNQRDQATATPKAAEFLTKNEKWIRGMVNTYGPTRAYWASVGLVLLQLDGLVAGYNDHRGSLNALTADQIMHLGMTVELGDYAKAADPASRPDFLNMTQAALDSFIHHNSHCSAIFKATADLSEVYASHNTWTDFVDMLRIFKVYKLPFKTKEVAGASTVMFSGYPATIAGIDDFYLTNQKLAVIETTNNVFNNSLFDSISSDETIPYWIRVTVATRAATNAKEWHEIFYEYNSGTYNNQWMTLDYKKFTPGQPLVPDTFWVSEQIPGHHHAEDQTMVLQRGHWPSYNVPFYADIYKMSGYPEIVAKFGAKSSYQLAPRAPIFRRDADAPQTLEGLQHFMRLNRWNVTQPSTGKMDPLFPNPGSAIASRLDLVGADTDWLGGAIDAKITSSSMAASMRVTAIAGPTNNGVSGDDQPVFEWTGIWNNGSFPHYGHPKRFDFPWVDFKATV